MYQPSIEKSAEQQKKFFETNSNVQNPIKLTTSTPNATPKCLSTNRDIINLIKQQQNRKINVSKEKPGKSQETLKKLKTVGQATPIIHRNLLQAVKSPIAFKMNKSKSGKNIFQLQSQQTFSNSASQNISKMNPNEKNSLQNFQPQIIRSNQKSQNFDQETSNKTTERQSKWTMQEEEDEEKQRRERSQRSAKEHLENMNRIKNLRLNENHQNPESPQKDLNVIKDTILDSNLKVCNEPTEVSMTNIDHNETKVNVNMQREYNTSSGDSSLERDSNSSEIRAEIGESCANIQPQFFQEQDFGEEYHPIQINRQAIPESSGWHGVLADQLNIEMNEQTSSSLGKRKYADYKFTKQSNNSQENIKKNEAFLKLIQNAHKNQDETYKAIQDLNKEIQSREKKTPCRKVKPANLRQEQSSGLRRNFSDNFDKTWIENSANKQNVQVDNNSQENYQLNQTKFQSAVIGNFGSNGGQTPQNIETLSQIILFGDLSQDLRQTAQNISITNNFIHEQMNKIKSDVAISQNDNRSIYSHQLIQKNGQNRLNLQKDQDAQKQPLFLQRMPHNGQLMIEQYENIEESDNDINQYKFIKIQEGKQNDFKNFDENSKQSGSTIENIQNKQSFDLPRNYLPNFHPSRKLQNLQAQEPQDEKEKEESFTEEELEKQTPQFQKQCGLQLNKNLFQKKFENDVKEFKNYIPKKAMENQTSVKKRLFQEGQSVDKSSSNLSQTPENHKRMKLKNSFSSMNSGGMLPQPFQPISQNFMYENQDPHMLNQIAFCKPILKQQSLKHHQEQFSDNINIRLFKNTSSAKSLNKIQAIQNQNQQIKSSSNILVLCQELQDGSFSARNLEFAAISNDGRRETVYSEKMKQEGILNFVSNQTAIQNANWKKGVHFKALVSSEERRNSDYVRDCKDQEVVSSKSSLIQRWRDSDKIFLQKYQNGTEKPLQNRQDDSPQNMIPESLYPNCNIIFENYSGQDSHSQLGLIKQRSTMNQMSSPSLANQTIFEKSYGYKTVSNYNLNNTLGNRLPQSIQNNLTGERNRIAHNFDKRITQNASSWPFSASIQSKDQVQKQPQTDHNPICSDSKVFQFDQQFSIIFGPNNEKICDKIRLNNTAKLNQDFKQNQVIEIQDQQNAQLRQFYVPDQTFKEDVYLERQKGAGYRARQSYAQDLQVNTANLIKISEMHRRDIPMSQGGISLEDPRTPVETQNCWLQQSQVSATCSSQNDCDGISSSLDTETNEQLGQYRFGKKGKHPAKIANFKVDKFYKEESVIPRSKLFVEHQDSMSGYNVNQNYVVSKFNISQKSNGIEKPINPINRAFFASNESGELKEMTNAAFEAKSGKIQLQFSNELYDDVNLPKVQLNNLHRKTISGNIEQQSQSLLSWMDREFERITKLGNGNFGQVIKCRNKTDGYEYAIKVTNIKNPQHSQSYLQEMQTLSALSAGSESPHIVRYFNSWVEKDKIYIVMELCQKSLLDIKRECKTRARLGYEPYIPEKQLRKIIRDVLLGLQELHKGNIVHLDIKPGNILLGISNNYKLGDLGLARFLTKITELTHIPEGDCRYLAQELLSKENFREIPDLKKADIFSVGITAYELLTLEDLEKNGSEWRKFRNGSFTYPKVFYEGQYSQQLLDSIAQMISPEPEARPNADYLLQNIFLSEEQERILYLEQENQKLTDKIIQLERRFLQL